MIPSKMRRLLPPAAASFLVALCAVAGIVGPSTAGMPLDRVRPPCHGSGADSYLADDEVVTDPELAAIFPGPLELPASYSEFTGPSQPVEGFGPKFLRAWIPITAGELALLGITASLPKQWTGWSSDFVADGVGNLGEAWSRPPVMDDDWWVHNYVGHPYGGSIYYNSIRSQGGSVRQSFLMSVILSCQWEYVIEGVAERPSIQDLIITPVVGSLVGEGFHRLAAQMRKNGTTIPEKVAITILNPMSAVFEGY